MIRNMFQYQTALDCGGQTWALNSLAVWPYGFKPTQNTYSGKLTLHHLTSLSSLGFRRFSNFRFFSKGQFSLFYIQVYISQIRIACKYLQLLGEGNGNPLQCSCLENPRDRGACWAAVNGVAQSQTRLNDLTFTFHFHSLEKEMATHSSILAWRIPGTEEPAGLPTVGSHRAGHDLRDIAAAATAAYINTVILYDDLVICNLAKSSYLFY